ncbi:tripartite tricarboxylate transporter substrate binding protein [Rhodoplanes sp. TEM]|uniref:Tripartite tricarboxylate transporter substrate binding protein n=1 Tax=Rhodoplanes tepidamans TaxID=200616 RepID=A0ABT5JF69_RHOTP|nr:MULTISPECIES: tripartite tricarboxylate transporter substrate binding protein [Rhodoplanes]MDC7788212.1 tripartite tricarboxylate transporter substrate binding protein [Rhodoplanes tepidamans]MDC7983554.1 tripartite tricarboxylate transporter substrate binding protein [Rhodoplanes sp. TEM]MDQ0354203.1 tripartite-type tricarboxylate transporter receptor subunit TctC [Rhodoplanes tepidamans]
MTLLKRLSLIVAAAIVVASPAASAQEFPSGQMRLIVPFAAGGAADIIGRTIAEKLGALYGKTIIVENMPGAGSNLGVTAAVRAQPDGHTLVLASVAVAANVALFKSLPFDPLKDLAPLTLALETPNVVIVPASGSIKTVQDLLAHAKKTPSSYASAGVGSSLHLAAELFKQQAGVDITHVPYRGSSPALTDLITGRIDVMFDNASTALPQVQGGKVRAIAVTTKARIDQLPDVPTVAESGLPGYEMSNWWALYVTAKTPPAVAAKLSADLRKVLADPDLKKRFDEVSGRIVASTAEELGAHTAREVKKWEQVVESAGIRASQ